MARIFKYNKFTTKIYAGEGVAECFDQMKSILKLSYKDRMENTGQTGVTLPKAQNFL